MYDNWEQIYEIRNIPEHPLYDEEIVPELIDLSVRYKYILALNYFNSNSNMYHYVEKEVLEIEKKFILYGINKPPTINNQELVHYKRKWNDFRTKVLDLMDYNICFKNLKEKYLNDKFEFYALCKKSQMHYNNGFEIEINGKKVTVLFQTQRYDLSMENFLKAIHNLEKIIPIMQNRIKKISDSFIVDFEKEKSILNFCITEHYDLVMKGRDYKPHKKDYKDIDSAIASFEQRVRTITFFFNSQNKPKFKSMLDDGFHELGHFINDIFIEQNMEKNNLYLNLLKKDIKLAFINQHITKEGSALTQSWYQHVSPKRMFFAKKKARNILLDLNSAELFAESFAEVIMKRGLKKPKKNKFKKLEEMYPHTNFFIEKMLDGKRANRFKSIKLKKQPTR